MLDIVLQPLVEVVGPLARPWNRPIFRVAALKPLHQVPICGGGRDYRFAISFA